MPEIAGSKPDAALLDQRVQVVIDQSKAAIEASKETIEKSRELLERMKLAADRLLVSPPHSNRELPRLYGEEAAPAREKKGARSHRCLQRVGLRRSGVRAPGGRQQRQRVWRFIQLCQAVESTKVLTGPAWIHKLKHDGFRILARKTSENLHLWSRNGRDWSVEFAGIATALKAWKRQSFVIDGEACACDDKGWPDFHALLGGGKACADACYFAFDLLELDGVDLRSLPFGERYARLARLLADAPELIHLSEHTNEYDGAAMFEHACRLGLEGIVAKRRNGRYRSGHCVTWVKVKNPGYERR